MIHIIFAQTMVEYGAMAAATNKVSGWFAQIELSLRTNPGTWLFGVGAILAVLWLARRS